MVGRTRHCMVNVSDIIGAVYDRKSNQYTTSLRLILEDEGRAKGISLNNIWCRFNSFPNKPWFLRVCNTSLLKTLGEKEKLLVTSNFSISQCFLPIWKTFCHFYQIQNCRLQTLSVWKSLKFFVWERVEIRKNILCNLISDGTAR